jgi:hypothetical protein
MLYAALVSGALVLGAGAAQAQGVAGDDYGPAAASDYGYSYGIGVRPDSVNPGASYGINSTEAGAAGAAVAGTSANASSQSVMMPGAIETGRAATYGAPPMGEDAEPY